MPSKLLKGEAPVVMEHRHVRLQADRKFELLFGCVKSVLLEQGDTKKIHRIDVLRLGFEDRPIRFFRLGDLSALMEALGDGEIGRHRAPPLGVEILQQLRRIGVMRVCLQNLAAGLRGAFKAAFLFHAQRAIENHR